MAEHKQWVAVTEDVSGKIRFFYKAIDEGDDTQIDNFVAQVSTDDSLCLAVFPLEEVVGHHQL